MAALAGAAGEIAGDEVNGFAWAAAQRLNPSWVILVAGGYGAFVFQGSEAEAEEMRAHKANWERAIAHKRPASASDFTRASNCWNHPGFLRLCWYGSRGRRLKRPWTPRFDCRCAECTSLERLREGR
jgi:hypothetical protein